MKIQVDAVTRRICYLLLLGSAAVSCASEVGIDTDGSEDNDITVLREPLGATSCATAPITSDNGAIISNPEFEPGAENTAGSFDDVYTAPACRRNFIVEVRNTLGRSFEWVTDASGPGSDPAEVCRGGIYTTMFGYSAATGWVKLGDQRELMKWYPPTGDFGSGGCVHKSIGGLPLVPAVVNSPYSKVRIVIEAHSGSFGSSAYDHKRVRAGIAVPVVIPDPT